MSGVRVTAVSIGSPDHILAGARVTAVAAIQRDAVNRVVDDAIVEARLRRLEQVVRAILARQDDGK